MRLDRRHEITRSAVMEKGRALTQSPQRRRAKLIGPRSTLGETIGKAHAHMMDQQVGEHINRLIREGWARTARRSRRDRLPGRQRGRMASGATDADEFGTTVRR